MIVYQDFLGVGVKTQFATGTIVLGMEVVVLTVLEMRFVIAFLLMPLLTVVWFVTIEER